MIWVEKYVYMFSEGDKSMKNLLGGKGANLAEMTKIGLPVPFGFTISTDACNKYYDDGKKLDTDIKKEIKSALEELEKKVGKKLGDPSNPLLVSVRSGARVSMPGMMDTVLNLGMNDKVCAGFAKKTKNPRFAYDSYRRFIAMYSNVVKGLDSSEFEKILSEVKEDKKVKQDTELTAIDLKEIVEKFKVLYKELTDESFPIDPEIQLMNAVSAVFKSWQNERAIVYRNMNDIPSNWGTAVNVQQMVYGNSGNDSGTGVAFTRNPATGENKLYGEYLMNAQGEDVVAGVRTPKEISSLKESMPEVYKEFEKYSKTLEDYYKDMQDMEFTIEDGKLYMLQTRNGKRTGAAALKIAVDLVDENKITKEEALLMVDARTLEQVLHDTFKPEALENATSITRGIAASPGAATGKLCFTAEEAVERKNAGEKDLILVRLETSPEDIEGMSVVNGILTIRGGMTSHAAVVARGMGRCCVSGCGELQVAEDTKTLTLPNKNVLTSEDYISLDGTTGRVYEGEIETEEASIVGNFEKFMSWADDIRRLKVRTNADTPETAKKAKAFGAEGIGLCRTEHMFFEKTRIFAFRKMILADTLEDREKALDEILPFQQEDFESIFEAMSPYGVVIRYLDPPLHEFLPKERGEILELAKALKINHNDLVTRIEALKEFNPMMGHRGCRLAVTYPEIAKMQTRAIVKAALKLNKEGFNIEPEIMIPLIGEVKELAFVRNIVEEEIKLILKDNNEKLKYTIGTMIEIPRAALTSREIAKQADFYSFGTNDLTQMTYGFSRDDASKFLNDYYKKAIFDTDPFAKLDVKGVGKLIEIGIREGRRTKESLKVGICGEQGGDPKSIEFLDRIGIDYVSCSPYRVPIARLAAAQATLKNKEKETN